MAISLQISTDKFDYMNLMRLFMGIFLVIFSMFKLFDIQGFAKGFEKYDFITSKYKNYALIYPYLELILGLAFLSNIQPILVNILNFIIMLFGGYGVIKSLAKGLNIKCACLGTAFNLPLSTVTIIENFGMSLMSLINLIIFYYN
jgi:hypothetical protein